jgi:hypothetical protein
MEYKKLNQPAAMGRKRIAVATAGDARAESRRTRSALGGATWWGSHQTWRPRYPRFSPAVCGVVIFVMFVDVCQLSMVFLA